MKTWPGAEAFGPKVVQLGQEPLVALLWVKPASLEAVTGLACLHWPHVLLTDFQLSDNYALVSSCTIRIRSSMGPRNS